MPAYQMETIAQGRTLSSATVQHQLVSLESAQPEGTRMELALAWADLRLPLIGPVDLASAAAGAVNAAYRAGRLVAGGRLLPLWPGDREPAAADPRRRTTRVRWLKAAPGVGAVVGAVEDGTAEEAAAGVGVGTAIALTLLALLAGVLVWQYLTHWRLAKAVASSAGGAIQEASAVGGLLLTGGVILAGVYVLRRLRGD